MHLTIHDQFEYQLMDAFRLHLQAGAQIVEANTLVWTEDDLQILLNHDVFQWCHETF